MVNKPLVSIIVPVYKVPESFLRTCIESLIAQTLKDIEIILIDDGSPDNCGKICDEYAGKDDRILVIHKKNGGLSAARNTGCKAAHGEYITFVDGDDWIEKETCAFAYEKAKKTSAEIVCWGTVKDYLTKSIPFEYSDKFIDGKVYSGNEIGYMQEMLLHYNGQNATAYSKLINRSFIEKNNIYHNEILRQGAEGLEFCLRLFECAERIAFFNKHFYHYIYNENSISAFPTEENNRYVLNCFQSIKEFIKTSKNRERLEQWFDNRLLYVIITTAISCYFNPANTESYAVRKRKYKEYLSQPIVKEALKTKNKKELSLERKIILQLINCHMFFLLNLAGKIRKKQKKG